MLRLIRLCPSPSEKGFLIGLHETQSHLEHLSSFCLWNLLEVMAGWLAWRLQVPRRLFPSMSKFRFLPADHNGWHIGMTNRFLKWVNISGLCHHSFPKQKPPF